MSDSMSAIAKTPQPPYYAVIFTSVRTEGDNGYEEMANEMVEKVFHQLLGQDLWYESFANRVCKVEKLGIFKIHDA